MFYAPAWFFDGYPDVPKYPRDRYEPYDPWKPPENTPSIPGFNPAFLLVFLVPVVWIKLKKL